VGDDRKVELPEELVGYFVEDGIDDSVFWNFERNAQFLVLSKRPLAKDEYQPVTRSKIYDENGVRKIRPPNTFSDSMLSKFWNGNELYYLLHDDMLKEDFSLYLLTKSEVLELLPGQADGGNNLRQRIMSTPGFLRSK
jgi:hypothetical protein